METGNEAKQRPVSLQIPPLIANTVGMARLKAPQRREQLIEVATKLFAQWGYTATTTAAIADAAGVTEPILYRHFKSKQELFVAITRAMSQQTLKRWHSLLSETENPAEQLRSIAKHFPAHVRDLSDAYHVIHGALSTSRDKKVQAVMREHYEQIESFFCDIVVKGQQQGLFREVDPKVPAWMLIHTGIGYAMIALNLSQFDPGLVEEAVEYVLRGLTT